jgi:hypothetical protein
VIQRGQDIEQILSARMFTPLSHYSRRFPWVNAVGSLLFTALWAGALFAALGRLLPG